MSTQMGFGIPTPNEDDEGTVSVSGSIEVSNDSGNPLPVSGGLTNTELRASDVEVNDSAAQALLQSIVVSLGDTVTANTVRELLLRIYGAVDGLELSIDNIELSADNIDLDMEQVEALLTTLNGKDFATQATLAALLAELQLKADLTEKQPIEGGNTTDVKVTLDGETVSLSPGTLEALETTSLPAATNTYGTAVGLAAAATAAIVNIPSTPAGFCLMGFAATGLGDGYLFAQINGATVLSSRIHNTERSVMTVLPNPIAVTTGSVVTLKVTNQCDNTTDYEATLLGVTNG